MKRSTMKQSMAVLILICLTLIYQNCSPAPETTTPLTNKTSASPTPTDNGNPYSNYNSTPTPTPTPGGVSFFGCGAAMSHNAGDFQSSQQTSAFNCLQFCKSASTVAQTGLLPQNNWNVCWYDTGFIYDNGAGNPTQANCHATVSASTTDTHGTFRPTATSCRSFCEAESTYTKDGLANGWNVCWFENAFIK